MQRSHVQDWAINRFVWRVAIMANQIGNTIGSAWITVAGLVAVAGIVGVGGFAIHSSASIAELSTQQTYMQRDLSDVRQDIKEIRHSLDDQGKRP